MGGERDRRRGRHRNPGVERQTDGSISGLAQLPAGPVDHSSTTGPWCHHAPHHLQASTRAPSLHTPPCRGQAELSYMELTAFPTQNSPAGLQGISSNILRGPARTPSPLFAHSVTLPWCTWSSHRPTLVSPQGFCNYSFVST